VGCVLLVPLAENLFLAVPRHPLAEMTAAFAGASGGYSPNLLFGTVVFMLGWMVVLGLWIALGLPVAPGVPLSYTAG
jgi:aminobenzoyl-glutamate transport protein